VGAEAIRIVRRIDTNIPLPQQEPFIFIRGILSLHGSSDGSVIAIGSELSPRKYFLNGTTGRSITEFDDPECRLGDDRIFNGRGPVISPDGRYAVFGIRGIRQKTVKILNVSTGNTVQALGDEKINHIETVAFSQEAVFALVHSVGDYEIAGWSLPQGVRIGRMKMPENREPSLLFPVAGGRTLVVVSHSRLTPQRLVPPQADLFDVQQNRHIRTLSLAYQDISAVAVSPDGKLLAVVGNHGDHKTLDVYDIVNNRKISSLGRFDGFSAQGVNFLPNGKIVVQTESAVTGYDAQTGQSKFAWTHNGNLLNRPITHLSFLSNGDMLMVLDGPMATLVIGRLNES
jgi:WD40 repeat protein